MQLVEIEVTLPDDVKAFVRSEVASGRYAYEDEVIVHALYLQAQELDRQGNATAETKLVMALTLEQTLEAFRQALAEKISRSRP